MECKKCPGCGDHWAHRVIYYGLPHWLCAAESCNCLWGIFSVVTRWLPFNGHMLTYVPHPPAIGYLKALAYWLRDGNA